jgi:tetratricopeptide (TPR) repeat protein
MAPAVAPETVLEGLARLVDQSLVLAEAPGTGAGRYRLLETLRQYAGERLQEAGEAEAVRARQAAWAAALAERAAPGLLGRDQLDWLARLDAEHDNLRAALLWSLGREAGTAVRLAGRLWPYWRMRDHHTEGTRWLAGALAGARERTADWARAALGAGILARDRGEVTTARAHLEASLECSRAQHERELAAWALRDLGQLHLHLGELGTAEALLAEGLALARAAGDQRGAAATLMIQAQGAALRGAAGQARALNEESLDAARLAGDRWLISAALLHLGIVAVDQGDLGAATPFLEEGLAVALDLGLLARAEQFRWQLGRVALAQGEPERAVPLLEALRATARERDSPRELADALTDLGRAAHARGEPTEAAGLLADALRLRRAVGDRLGSVECLEALAAVATGVAPARAARLLGAAAAERRASGAPPPPILQPGLAATERAARAALGAPASDAARAEGEALSLERAVAEALREAPPGAP